ncbi:MAG: PEP-CTERM sorting domain-containing protein [Myxococcota bacterium]
MSRKTSSRFLSLAGLAALAALVLPAAAAADSVSTSADFDRWMYPFNATPGIRNLAPTFGAFDGPTFDNRDGEMIVGFDTAAAGVPSGLGSGAYEITSVTVTATHFQGDFLYDPTYDSYLTYDGSLADADAGRPIEIHGLGFRSGFSGLELAPAIPGPPGFAEDDAFAYADPTLQGVRNVIPVDALGNDVSNNVRGGFESNPWAIGQVDGLAPGDAVPEGTPGVSAGATFSFDIDLSDPMVLAYVAEGLDDGVLGFVITSLHTTTEAGGVSPNFYTGDNFDPAAIAPTIAIEYTLVPEPGTAWLLAAALAGLACVGRKRSARI